MDQELDRVALHLFAPSIDAVFQITAGQDRTRARQQGLQQCELTVGELHRGAVMGRGAGICWGTKGCAVKKGLDNFFGAFGVGV